MKITVDVDVPKEAIYAALEPRFWKEVDERVAHEMDTVLCILSGEQQHRPLTLCVWTGDTENPRHERFFVLGDLLEEALHDIEPKTLALFKAELQRLLAMVNTELNAIRAQVPPQSDISAV